MAIASGAFIDAIRYGSYLVQGRLTIYSHGTPTQYQVPISQASITVDRNAAQRRQGSITAELVPSVPPPPLLPTSPSSLLSPFGNELFLETGINTPGQPIIWYPSGLFTITTVTVDDTTVDLVVTLDVADRSFVISQRVLKKPYNFPATPSGNFVAEIQALLNMVWGTPLAYNIVPTDAVVPPASYNQGSDPWQAALDMAAAVGYELFFDAQGIVRGYPIPDPATQPVVWNFTDEPTAIFGNPGTGSAALFGSPYSTPVAVQMQMTRQSIYNDIIVTGVGTSNAPLSNTGSNAPVLAEAADTNPQSSTYIGGGLGDVPNFVSTNMVTSAAQAQATANNDLQAALSAAWTITVSAPPNPIFDVDNVVTVTRPRIGISNLKMVIDTVTHVVRYSDTMAITGRVVP
jgi:hypothetical protein